MRSIRRRPTRLLGATLTAAGIAGALTASASAEQIVGNGPFGMPTIVVDTGPKNHSNRTQLVRSIYIETPGHCDGGKAEAWTKGWYASREICSATFFYINKWVPSGNGVCARVWVYVKQPWPFRGSRWVQSVACISIKV